MIHDEIVLEMPRSLASRVARCLSDCTVKAAQPILAPIPVEVEIEVLDRDNFCTLVKRELFI